MGECEHGQTACYHCGQCGYCLAMLRSERDRLTSALAAAESALRVMRETLDGMLEWALANRGKPSEFVRCYTYATGKIPEAIVRAKAALSASQVVSPAPRPSPVTPHSDPPGPGGCVDRIETGGRLIAAHPIASPAPSGEQPKEKP